jgi:6-phosphofructokinase 1
MAKKRIGILTGGGDVPGLNSVIKTVTYRSSENDIEVIGLRRGWEALTHLNVDDAESRRRYVMPLDRENTRIIDRRGGTVLHSSARIFRSRKAKGARPTPGIFPSK